MQHLNYTAEMTKQSAVSCESVLLGFSKYLAVERTDVVKSAWNVSRTQTTFAMPVLGRPLRFFFRGHIFISKTVYAIYKWCLRRVIDLGD